MADVNEGSAPETSPVHEGQRSSRIVSPGEDRGHKAVVPDLGKGQKPLPVDGSKTEPGEPPTMPPEPPPPRPKKKE